MEKELVRKLGEQIGYGNMMELASECWKESMIEKGYPTSGVFIPALPRDVRGQNDETSGNSLHKHVVTNSGELTDCHAGKDGECNHPNCPQIRDGEPEKTGRSCPLWDVHKDIYF